MARILVVERDAKIRELLSRLLGVKGHEVTTAVDGGSGMQAFIAERPDLMLVELQLADMTGIELCRAVRDTHLDVRLVLMGTARQARRSAGDGAREALDAPLFLVKPFGIDALMAAVEGATAGVGEAGARRRAGTAPLPAGRRTGPLGGRTGPLPGGEAAGGGERVAAVDGAAAAGWAAGASAAAEGEVAAAAAGATSVAAEVAAPSTAEVAAPATVEVSAPVMAEGAAAAMPEAAAPAPDEGAASAMPEAVAPAPDALGAPATVEVAAPADVLRAPAAVEVAAPPAAVVAPVESPPPPRAAPVASPVARAGAPVVASPAPRGSAPGIGDRGGAPVTPPPFAVVGDLDDDDDFARTDEQAVAGLIAELGGGAPAVAGGEDADEAAGEVDDPGASYGASTAGGLLAGDSMEIVSVGIDFEAPPAGHTLEAVYPLDEVAGDRHTWGVDSLQMEAIRHGPVNLDEDERRYSLEPMVPQGPADPRGIYGAVTLPQLLYRCFSDLFTGRLVIRRGPVRKQVLLANGRPIGAESNIRSESLGYLLLRDGIIDQAQLAQSVRVARQLGIRQGEALVRIGAIAADAMPDYLRRQLRARLLGCFAWSGADYGLVYEPDVRASREAVELNPLVLIFDGIKTSFPVGPLVHHYDARNRSPVRATERLRDYATMLRPFADDLRVATLCDGQRTLGEVLSASPFGLIDTLRVLRALEITGCVEFGEARAPDASAEVRGPLTPRATVGGSLDGSMSGVVPSRRSRRTISDPPPAATQTVDVVDSDDEMPSEVDLERIRRVATRRRRARVTETGPDLVQAETNFSKGKRALEGDELQEALAHFALACRQDPHEPLFRMYHAFARFQAAGSDKRGRAEALDELKGAVDGAPDHDEGQVLLGHAWRVAGNAEAAAKHYRKALALNRRNPHANQALREMEGRRALQERDPAGLFGKFFTRR